MKRKINFNTESEEFKSPPKLRKGEDTPMNCLLDDVRNTQKAMKKLGEIITQYEVLLNAISARESEIEADADVQRRTLAKEWETLENEKFLITTLREEITRLKRENANLRSEVATYKSFADMSLEGQ